MSFNSFVINHSIMSPVLMPEELGIKRIRPRPPEYRQETYNEEYDFNTLFYDVFLSQDRNEIVLAAPPLLNFKEHINEATIKLCDGEIEYDVKLTFSDFDRYTEANISIPSNMDKSHLFLTFDLGNCPLIQVPVQQNYQEILAGKNVVMTMYKYDHLCWIKDWIEFHVKYHNANAFVLYNNNSSYVANQDLIKEVRSIKGLDVLVIVDWPFLYGPQAAGTGFWDSNFAQHAAFGHCRHRFLLLADGVLNVDIDELLILSDHQSIFAKLQETKVGYITFYGIWASAKNDQFEDIMKRRHVHYQYHDLIHSEMKQSPAKWIVNPKRCSRDMQWTTHEVKNMEGYSYPNDQVRYRHFRNLNMGWKVDRTKPLLAYNKDRLLIEAYEKIGWI